MKFFKRIFPILTIASLLVLPSCFNDDESYDYLAWRDLNLWYIDSISKVTTGGELQYNPITPVWDKSITVYLKWHNDKEETANNLSPLSTSTCLVKYTLRNIAGDTLDSSSKFTCVPNGTVTGFMTALTNMHVKDSVTAVIPYTAGYGVFGSGSILPFTTLIFDIKLDSISKLM